MLYLCFIYVELFYLNLNLLFSPTLGKKTYRPIKIKISYSFKGLRMKYEAGLDKRVDTILSLFHIHIYCRNSFLL